MLGIHSSVPQAAPGLGEEGKSDPLGAELLPAWLCASRVFSLGRRLATQLNPCWSFLVLAFSSPPGSD